MQRPLLALAMMAGLSTCALEPAMAATAPGPATSSDAPIEYGQYKLDLCQPYSFITQHFVTENGWEVTMRTLDFDDVMIELMVRPDDGTWILFAVDADKLACWITGGEVPLQFTEPVKGDQS